MALNAPNPPSVVADPPRPTIILFAPCSIAQRINSPVPFVVASNGLFISGPPATERPEARAISITAVFLDKRHSA